MRIDPFPRALPGALLVALACAGPDPRAAPPTPDLEIVEVGRYNFQGGEASDPRLVAEEVSGLDRVEGDRYVAVGDEHAALHFLEIEVDRATGRVASTRFVDAVPLSGPSGAPADPGLDLESVGYDPDAGVVWIADEGGPSLRRHAMDGRTLQVVDPSSDPALAPFASIRPNLGFEASARRPDGGWWIANEEALTIDGPPATPEAGSVVRLVAFDPSMRPTAQYAYVTDPVQGPIASPTTAVGHELSGVVGLVALDSGDVLVLERALGGDPSGMAGFRLRIYVVDLEGATDVGSPPWLDGLAGGGYHPVGKRLLYESRHGLLVSNFEAFGAGPELLDGSRSLLLMADNGGGTWQSVLALRIEGPISGTSEGAGPDRN